MAKGGGFEREMSKKFSLWWTKGKRDDIFWRTSNSGGRATMRGNKSTAGQYGDMGFIDPIGKPLIDFFTFEFKRGYQSSLIHDLFDDPFGNPKSVRNWEKWIHKAETERARAGALCWMIVHRRNRREPLVVMPITVLSELDLQKDFGKTVPKFKATIWARPRNGEKHKRFTIIGMPLENALVLLKSKEIKWVVEI